MLPTGKCYPSPTYRGWENFAQEQVKKLGQKIIEVIKQVYSGDFEIYKNNRVGTIQIKTPMELVGYEDYEVGK